MELCTEMAKALTNATAHCGTWLAGEAPCDLRDQVHGGSARNGADLRVNRATVDETRREDTRFVLVSGLLMLDMTGFLLLLRLWRSQSAYACMCR